MNGKKIGAAAAARINAIVDDVRTTCKGDPRALVEASTVLGRLLSFDNEDSPVTKIVRDMRVEAIIAMHESGMSDEQIARELTSIGFKISRSRVQQLRTTASEGARKSEHAGYRKPSPAPIQREPGSHAA